MFRKGILAFLVTVMMIFAAGSAYADDIDGLTDVGDTGGYFVYVNPGNLGDTLIYGYYNVRGYGNFFSIVNTSDVSGVIARVRFREAVDSYEVLDFNICLSKDDMWTAFIVDDGTQGRLISNDDDTLTAPTIPTGGVAFKHSGNGGISGVTADETREGYYEVIGLVTTDAEPTDCPSSTTSLGPVNDVPNVLMGAHFMAEDETGLTFAYRAMALAEFHIFGIASTGLGTESVTLANGIDASGGINPGVDWAATKETINSEYMLGLPSEGATGEAAYVVTFFTKKLNVDADTGMFGDATCNDDTGVTISVDIFDDEENSITTPEQFSPIITTQLELCYEANVIELGNDTVTSDILNSGVEIDISAGTFELGWIRVDLYNAVLAHSTVSEDGFWLTNGLPAWVWWLQTVDGELSHANEMAYTTDIVSGG